MQNLLTSGDLTIYLHVTEIACRCFSRTFSISINPRVIAKRIAATIAVERNPQMLIACPPTNDPNTIPKLKAEILSDDAISIASGR